MVYILVPPENSAILNHIVSGGQSVNGLKTQYS